LGAFRLATHYASAGGPIPKVPESEPGRAGRSDIVEVVFDHVTIRASDRAASELFYDTVLPTLGVERTNSGETFTEWSDFSLAQAADDDQVTRGLHIGFAARSRELVHAFWDAGTEDGFRDDGEPGPRTIYGPDYYGGFLLDPDDNSAEAAYHSSLRRGGVIDHLWIRVADLAASKAFYETIAAPAGFRLKAESSEFARFTSGDGSFTVIAGPPTENVHMAFPVADNAAVDAFHAAAIAAGYDDNGAPGERPEYHEGYYSAFVLDPGWNNIEVINHNR
jgi:catechol 2,3-dioxygenase-like lactoylglutathione lyase family enzyme